MARWSVSAIYMLISTHTASIVAYLKQRERRHRVAFAALRALIPHTDFELDFDLARAASQHVDAGAEGALREREREVPTKR